MYVTYVLLLLTVNTIASYHTTYKAFDQSFISKSFINYGGRGANAKKPFMLYDTAVWVAYSSLIIKKKAMKLKEINTDNRQTDE